MFKALTTSMRATHDLNAVNGKAIVGNSIMSQFSVYETEKNSHLRSTDPHHVSSRPPGRPRQSLCKGIPYEPVIATIAESLAKMIISRVSK